MPGFTVSLQSNVQLMMARRFGRRLCALRCATWQRHVAFGDACLRIHTHVAGSRGLTRRAGFECTACDGASLWATPVCAQTHTAAAAEACRNRAVVHPQLEMSRRFRRRACALRRAARAAKLAARRLSLNAQLMMARRFGRRLCALRRTARRQQRPAATGLRSIRNSRFRVTSGDV